MSRKGFFVKFRVSRVIPTFHSCRSKDPSNLPTNPVPSFLRHHSSAVTTTANRRKYRHVTTPPPPHGSSNINNSNSKPIRFSLKSHVSSAFSSARRGCLRARPSPEPSHAESSSLPPLPFKWHVITKFPPDYNENYDSTPPRRKIYNSAASETERENDVVFLPPPPSKTRPRKARPNRRRRTSFQKVRLSTSSDSGLFSEDDDNDNQTLVSSDSPSPLRKSKERENHHNHNKKKNIVGRTRRSFELSAGGGNTSPVVPARLSEFMRRMAPCRAVANGKVRESFAMVKRSEEPYEDFKRSMVEMVVEKQMFEERELEELLRCFLSLNSERHHEAIVRAFTEIWKGLFCQSSSSP